MTITRPEQPGLPGSAGNSEPTEPASLLSAYRSTALLDRLRATEYSYLDAGGQVYLDYAGAGLSAADWRRALRGAARTTDQYLHLLGLPSGGALRASVGLASNLDDVERFVTFIEQTYQNRTVDTGSLAPRRGC